MAAIRLLALAVIREGGSLLVEAGYDSVKDETFYRLLGGGIEFGENGSDAVTRELLEEIGAAVDDPTYVGTIENLFTYEGEPGHEVALVYAVTLRDRRFLERSAWESRDESGAVLSVAWKHLDDFRAGARLYPEGTLELVERATA